MTTRERRTEYSSSNVVRVLSPTRPLSPNQPTTEYDNNLEYLLEDLQQSISRPGSSLGQSSAPMSSYNTTSRDVQYLSPSNTSTVVRERSRSPNSENQRVYKTATYEYSTNSNQPTEMQQNIHQLDTLLSDLNNERERDSSLDRNKYHNSTISNVGIDSGLLEPIPTGGTTKIIKQTTYSTDYNDGKPTVQRELYFDSPDHLRQSRPRQKSPEQKYFQKVEKTVKTTTTKDGGQYPTNDDDGLYGGINRHIITTRQDRALSPPKSDKYLSNTSYNVKTTKTTTKNDINIPPNVPYSEIVHVETQPAGSLPMPLEDLQLSPDILPKPSTKVTTTVRTYTYEIPAEPVAPTTNKTIVYQNESYDTTTNTIPPHHIIQQTSPAPNQPTNQTIIYKNESHTTNRNIDYPENYPPHPKPHHHQPTSPPPTQPGVNKTIIYKTDTRETTTNRYPQNQYPPNNTNSYPIVEFPPEPPTNQQPNYPQPTNTTIIYKENIIDRNTNIHHPPPQHPAHPVGFKPAHPPTGNTPPQPGPKTTYIYKHESSNTTNTHYGPPGGPNDPQNRSPYPNDKYPKGTVLYPSNAYPPNDNYGGPPHSPPNDTNITYKYTTHTTNTRNVNTPGFPYEKEPLLQPTPFPTDGYGPDSGDGNPPKRLDDLMATFGDNNRPNNQYNNGPMYGEQPLTPSKENYTTATAVSKPIAPVEPRATAKNLTGPAVYYPPGHELFAKKEESQASYRAQGGYAKASGKYMYEAESRSKSKSSSGGAVVPVCLPLCCAMPCVIM